MEELATVNLHRELYYELFDSFSRILHKHNPCQWIGDTCFINRETNTRNGCCQKCVKNTSVGCSIQSLGCKAFLCDRAFYNLPKRAQNKWRILTETKECNLKAELRQAYTNK